MQFALVTVAGVHDASVDLEAARAHVSYDASKTDVPALIAAVEKVGYGATALDSARPTGGSP